jgi:hypothetical protein
MSLKESIFSKIMIGVSIVLLATAIIGIAGMYKAQAINENDVEHNKSEIIETRVRHKEDIDKIGIRINEVKSNQTIMMEDIKDILKNMPK